MKQILQHLRDGTVEIAELPCPSVGPGEVLIQNHASLISAGTERMLVEFSQANLIAKARQEPERVKQVLDKIKTDGLSPTLDTVFRKLDQPVPLGYCSAGQVIAIGANVHDICPGDRIASNGGHAEIVCVPRNLCCPIPDGVDFEAATFTVLGSIALQGVRLAQPSFGETVMVFGMGLLGLLTAQILSANGCRVLAVDLKDKRLALAKKFGVIPINPAKGDDPVQAAMNYTNGLGVDSVLVTAAARKDSIIHQAAGASRKRGHIILVGVVDLELQRKDFYEKELSFQVSCSYGPGRYDPDYEQGGHDYPPGYVRWTEGRNFEAILSAIASNKISPHELISDRIPISQAASAYEKISHDPDALGIILTYPQAPEISQTIRLKDAPAQEKVHSSGKTGVAVIGAGNFATSTLLPVFPTQSIARIGIADLDPKSARQAAKKFGFQKATTDYKTLLADDTVDSVFILAGHRVHASLVMESLEAGKNVFVEKPLAITQAELKAIAELRQRLSQQNRCPMLMVGFNRRFSPHIQIIKKLLAGRSGPLCMNMTVNAGYIPSSHWTQNPVEGGGRIIGEGCHFIDLLASLADAKVTTVSALMVGGNTETRQDKIAIILRFQDGSIGTVNYFSNGNRGYPKESLEIFSDGRILKMNNFRITSGWGFRKFSRFKTRRQDKGHSAEVAAFCACSQTGQPSPIPFSSLYNSSLSAILAVQSANTEVTISLASGSENVNNPG